MASPTTAFPAWQRDFALLALSAFAAFALPLLSLSVLNDGDTNWHVATGQWILAHRGIPATDPFSFAAVGRPWVTHEWLSEVLMALAYAAAGWNGVRVLTAIAATAAALLMANHVRREVGWVTGAAILTLSFWVLGSHVQARPHLIALPILILWTLELMRARAADRTPALWLLPVMALWANLHGSFVFGLAFTGFFALEAFFAAQGRRVRVALKWGGFLAACLAMALITPNGFDGMVYPLKVMAMPHLQAISEWRPANFGKFNPVEVALFATLAAGFYFGVRIAAVRLALLLLLLHMTLQHLRQEIVLAAVGPLLLAAPFGRALGAPSYPPVDWPPLRELAAPVAVIAAILLGLAGWRLTRPDARRDATNAPVSALNHVPASLRGKPVFNDYGFGGWLIFNGVKPFIDGRSDMYGDDHLKTYLDVDSATPKTVDTVFSRYGIQWVIVRPNSGLLRVLDATPGWRRLYADRWAVVEARDIATDNRPESN
ncbi:MAG TPA: hypothetical protein VGL66_00405 [Caulobacteraceae bacterium]|jgi:hypothetical protein